MRRLADWSRKQKVGLLVVGLVAGSAVAFGIWWATPKYAFPADVERTVLFRQGEAGYHTFRIPGLLALPNQTILAFCEGRQDSTSDFGDIDTVLKRSTDDGRTWGPLQVLWDDPTRSLSNPCPVYDAATGTIFLHVVLDRADHYVMNSTDAGLTWSAPRVVNAGPAEWAFQGPSPGHGLQLASGRLLVPGMYNTDPGAETGTTWGSYCFYSDDHGRTWTLGHDFGLGTNECTCAQLANGAVLFHLRANRDANVARKYEALSTDGGETASPPRLHPGLVTPICMSGLLALPNGTVVFSNPAHPDLRVDFTVRVSTTGGITWARARQLYAGPSAYSDLAPLASGEVACLVECGQNYYQETVSFLRVPLEAI